MDEEVIAIIFNTDTLIFYNLKLKAVLLSKEYSIPVKNIWFICFEGWK